MTASAPESSSVAGVRVSARVPQELAAGGGGAGEDDLVGLVREGFLGGLDRVAGDVEDAAGESGFA